MSKQTHSTARDRTKDHLGKALIDHHMFYGPTDDAYWSEPFRIVAINLEAVGYQDCHHVTIDREALEGWLKGKTPKATFALISALLGEAAGRPPFDKDQLFAASHDDMGLRDAVRRSTYFNMRPTSNSRIQQDYRAIAQGGGGALRALIWDELKALEPHVVVVSGAAATAALNTMMQLPSPLKYRDHLVHPYGFFIQSLTHLSRASYRERIEALYRIAVWRRGGP